jgi:hypothetical protein
MGTDNAAMLLFLFKGAIAMVLYKQTDVFTN